MIDFRFNTSSKKEIETHLTETAEQFIPPLYEYCEIAAYSVKIKAKCYNFEAWDTTQLVGLLAVYLNQEKALAYITNLSIDKNYSGKRIGKKLISELYQYCLRNNLKKIELEVFKVNKPAIKFYTANNFRPIEERNKTIIMSKSITRDYNQEFKDNQDRKYAYNFDFDVMHGYMVDSFKPFLNAGNLLELGSFKVTKH